MPPFDAGTVTTSKVNQWCKEQLPEVHLDGTTVGNKRIVLNAAVPLQGDSDQLSYETFLIQCKYQGNLILQVIVYS